MLFMGSKAYPELNGLMDLVNNYNGYINAYTDNELTNYYFEIGNGGFDSAIDMFAKMFAEPLFDPNAIEKEIINVNSENEKNINNNHWKMSQILKTFAKEEHPYSRFHTGNKDTLDIHSPETLTKKLKQFFKTYYYAENMKLVVLSNQNIDTLLEKIDDSFITIKSKPEPSQQQQRHLELIDNEKAFNNTNLVRKFLINKGTFIWYNKTGTSKSLDIIFQTEEIKNQYSVKPHSFISYLLNYAGENSLIESLKSKRLINSLKASTFDSLNAFSLFNINFDLTEKGFNNLDKIVEETFTYLNVIRNNTSTFQSLYDEIKQINQVFFKFLDKSSEYGDFLSSLSHNMMEYDNQDILYGDYYMNNYNESVILSHLNSLTIDNSLIIVGSNKQLNNNTAQVLLPESKGVEVEKWYNTSYEYSKLPESYIKTISNLTSSELKIRNANVFITKEKDLVEPCISDCKPNEFDFKNENYEPLIYNKTNIFNVFYKIDKTFKLPKTSFYFNVYFDEIRKNSLNILNGKILSNIINFKLETDLMDAINAGNSIGFNFNNNDFTFAVVGFTDIGRVIIEKIMNVFINVEENLDQDFYDQMRENAYNDLISEQREMPARKANKIFKRLIKVNETDYSELLEIYPNSSITNFKEYLQSLKSSMKINMLIHGAVSEQDLKLTYDKILQKFNETDSQRKTKENPNLVKTLHAQYNYTGSYSFRANNDDQLEQNHATRIFFRVDHNIRKKKLILALYDLIFSQLLFDELRTERGLGYIVQGSRLNYDEIPYYSILVQGTKKYPKEVEQHILEVLNDMYDVIQNLSDLKLQKYKQTIKDEVTKRDENLSYRTEKIWNEISSNTMDFNKKNSTLYYLNEIRLKDLLETFEDIFIYNPNKLSIQLYSNNTQIDEADSDETYYLNKNIKTVVFKNKNIFSSSPLIFNNYEQNVVFNDEEIKKRRNDNYRRKVMKKEKKVALSSNK